MMRNGEVLARSIEPITSSNPLRKCVRRALYLRCARLHAVVAAAGIASVTPFAMGAAFPPIFPLESLYPAGGGDGSQGFVLTGVHESDHSGFSVSAAGDVNGDSIDDVIIGAWGADGAGGKADAGETYV